MKILEFLIYIYLLLRPYYFFKSGFLQTSDIFFLIGFLVFIFVSSKNKKLMHESIKRNIHYLFFLICVFVINTIYFLIYNDMSFILSSLYYLFNFFIIMIFSFFITDDYFLKTFNKIIKANLIIQLFLFISGLGRYWMGTFRYMGTFNDPNQFAYYVLISFCFLIIFKYKLKCNNHLFLFFIISFLLIFESSSTGMLLGLFILIIGEIDSLKNIPSFIKNHSKSVLIIIFILLLVPIIIMEKPELYKKITNSHIILRVEEKINKSQKENGILKDRGYDIITSYPQYLIYGSGQGKYERFYEKTGHSMEIHATFPSILFYYGIIPTYFLFLWIYNRLKKIDYKILVIYIALFIESLTLLNQRQALFWIIILLGNVIRRDINEKTS